jgi:poly(A) polymerase
MDRAGLLTVLFPEGEPMRKTAHVYYGKEGVWGHSLAAVASLDKLLAEELDAFFPGFAAPLKAHLEEPVGGYPRYALLKLVELMHDVGKPATAKVEDGKLHFHGHDHAGMKLTGKTAARLRLSNDEARSLGRMVGAHMRFYRDLEGDAVGMLIVALADHFTYLSDKQRRAQKDPVYLAIKKLLSHNFLRREVVQPPKLVDGNWLMEKLDLEPGPHIGRLLNGIREAQAAGQVKTPAQALKTAEKLLKERPVPNPAEKSEGDAD